ncbi:unnamed protein product [Orchesella dallaii]|uniref:Uncharacterized protein n=1 Tax=Orchesella dallaii TaxID=48710 RepID=A0ABP1QY40_9HEXA
MARKRAARVTKASPLVRVTRARAVKAEPDEPPIVETTPEPEKVGDINPSLNNGSAAERNVGKSKKSRARKAPVKSGGETNTARDTESPPHLVPEVPEVLPFMNENNEMPELHEPMSPQPTEGHEVINFDAPMQAENPDRSNPDVPVAGPSRDLRQQNTLPKRQGLRSLDQKDHKAGWQYQSTTIPAIDIQDSDDKVQMRNHFWHDVKMLTGSQLRIKMTDEVAPPSHRITFEVLGFLNKNGRRVTGGGLPLATTTVNFQRGQRSKFVFNIIDAELATAHRVSIQIMKEAAESVFETSILRCFDPSGHDSQISAEDVEVLSNEVEVELGRGRPSSIAP